MEDLNPHNSKTNLNNNQVVSAASNDLATHQSEQQQPPLAAVVLATTEDTDKTAKGNDNHIKRRTKFESVNGDDNFNRSTTKFGKDYFDTLPPGLRFCPYDTELITHYLAPKIFGRPLPPSRIFNVRLYKHNPEYLAENYREFGEREWYFFTPRYRKYRNGDRPNRAAGDGYWKATGADKPVKAKGSKIIIGSRKALVFYRGKAPLGKKTNWIMHEFRVSDPPEYKKIDSNMITYDDTNDEDEDDDSDMGLDNWVLCRIYKKSDKRLKSQIENDNPSPAPSPDDYHHQQYDDQQGNNQILIDNVIVYDKQNGFSSPPMTTPPPPAMYIQSVGPPGVQNIVLPPHISSSNNYLITVVEPLASNSLYPGPVDNDDIFGWNYSSFFSVENQLDQQILHFSCNDESSSGDACQPTQPRQDHH